MFEQATITFDLLCISCDYNLRGLPTNHLCPECGVLVLESLSACDPIEIFDRYDALRRSAMQLIAERVGCKEDGILFVYDTLTCSSGLPDRALSPHISAKSAMQSLQGYSMEYFNDREEAFSLLTEWGIHRSEDVSQILQGMLAAGLLNGSTVDSPDAFVGLFDLYALWPTK